MPTTKHNTTKKNSDNTDGYEKHKSCAEHAEHNHNEHEHVHEHKTKTEHKRTGKILTVRATSGLSGDMILAGLILMNNLNQAEIDAEIDKLSLPGLKNCLRLEKKSINNISGFSCTIDLPHEHSHRKFTDICTIIADSTLESAAKDLAQKTFSLLAETEGAVHNKDSREVTFHEVGALDSILDICLAASLYVKLAPTAFVCSPLPLADGSIYCAHGWLPSPAPAVLHLLKDIPICPFAGEGETVTPTAIALLKSFGPEFGPWPEMLIERSNLVYGEKVFANAPNGAIWALGKGFSHV